MYIFPMVGCGLLALGYVFLGIHYFEDSKPMRSEISKQEEVVSEQENDN